MKSDGQFCDIEILEKIRFESNQIEQKKREAEKISIFLKDVPLRFNGKSFADYQANTNEQLRVRSIAEKFIETFSQRMIESSNLFFLGNIGTGKTFLSLLMYQEIVKNGFSAKYESSTQFLKILQEKRFESNSSYQAVLNHYKTVQFLILDEITESLTKDGKLAEIEQGVLFDVINSRYEAGKCCTVLISNRSKKELANRIGARTFDRLSEKNVTLIFNWESYR